MQAPITVDLFCGAGGITEGFRQVGFNCVFANDISIDAVATFKANHPTTEAVTCPIEDLDPHRVRVMLGLAQGELDCLAAGPPCQGFSINAPERFVEDPRNSLFRHYLRFIHELKPKTIMFENVPGMLSLADGRIARQVTRHLMALGYDVSQRILFAAHYGVPQERWRLIILGSRAGGPPQHPFPTHNANGRANFSGGRTLTFQTKALPHVQLRPHVTVGDAIADLPPLRRGEGAEDMPYPGPPHSEYATRMRKGSATVKNHFAPKIAAINLQRLRFIAPGGSWRDIPYELLPAGMKRARASDHTRRYGRLKPDGLAGTVMTKMDPHWGPAFHYHQQRTLTVREAARLQSFPDRYVFTGSRVSQYEQVGNAVPVLMARAVAESVIQSITSPMVAGVDHRSWL